MSRSEISSAVIIPLLISGCGIAITALVILTYHFLIVRFCLRRRNFRNRFWSNETVSETELSFESAQFGGRVSKKIGLDKSALALIPTVNRASKAFETLIQAGQCECAICLIDIDECPGTGHLIIRLLPNCRHVFHADCVDEWLSSHLSCPTCRRMVFPFMCSDAFVLDIMEDDVEIKVSPNLLESESESEPKPESKLGLGLASPNPNPSTVIDIDTNESSIDDTSHDDENDHYDDCNIEEVEEEEEEHVDSKEVEEVEEEEEEHGDSKEEEEDEEDGDNKEEEEEEEEDEEEEDNDNKEDEEEEVRVSHRYSSSSSCYFSPCSSSDDFDMELRVSRLKRSLKQLRLAAGVITSDGEHSENSDIDI